MAYEGDPVQANPRAASAFDQAFERLGGAEARLSVAIANLGDKLQPVWCARPELPSELLAMAESPHSPHVAALNDHAEIVARLADRVEEMLHSIEL